MKRFHYALITAAFAALLLSACGSADTDTAGQLPASNSLVVLNYWQISGCLRYQNV